MDERDDYADPDAAPSRLPSLLTLAVIGAGIAGLLLALLGLLSMMVSSLPGPHD